MKFILGLKLGTSQTFDKEGNHIPITLVEAGPCYITQIKTKEPRSITGGKTEGKKPRARTSSVRGGDGYDAIQIGFIKLKEKKIKKPQKQKPFRYLREFRGNIDISKYKVGDEINVPVFQEGEKVKVSGVSKGKGFSGAVKKWGFKGRLSATHGTKHELRGLGSVGISGYERVAKGKKMPGRMGSDRITVKNLEIVKIDKENNLLAIKGALPGRNGTLLEIRA